MPKQVSFNDVKAPDGRPLVQMYVYAPDLLADVFYIQVPYSPGAAPQPALLDEAMDAAAEIAALFHAEHPEAFKQEST